MPALTIKNIPDDLYRELKHTAEQHQRSINSEVIMCLQNALLPKKTSPEDRLESIRALRSRIRHNAVPLEEIDQAINEGRP
jgi:plasmid stability protein